MLFKSTKTYGHERGLSCAFRQWRADSHCSLIHGYALSIHIEFSAKALDERNWVIDFGGLKSLEKDLKSFFDHTVVIAADDPQINSFCELEEAGLATVRILPNVGCEAFASFVYGLADEWVKAEADPDRVWVSKVEVREHGANSAIYEVDNA